MFSRITLSPAMRDGKAIDVADMLLEAAADVERAAHLNPSHHRQHIGRREDTEREFAEGRKGITLKPGQQPRSMPSIKCIEAVAMPFARRLLEGHLRPGPVRRARITPLVQHHFDLDAAQPRLGECDLAPVSPDGFKRLQKPVRDARAVNAF